VQIGDAQRPRVMVFDLRVLISTQKYEIFGVTRSGSGILIVKTHADGMSVTSSLYSVYWS